VGTGPISSHRSITASEILPKLWSLLLEARLLLLLCMQLLLLFCTCCSWCHSCTAASCSHHQISRAQAGQLHLQIANQCGGTDAPILHLLLLLQLQTDKLFTKLLFSSC